MAKAKSTNLASDQPTSWLSRILSLIGLEPDPERERKALLKDIRNQLKKAHGKFIKLPDQVDVGLARFFYEIYTVVGSAQSLLQNSASSQALKMIFIEQVLSANQKILQEELSENGIRELMKTLPFEQAVERVRTGLVDFTAALEIETQKTIDGQYNLFLAFLDFVNFNYYFLLKKFDSMLPESDFGYIPRFESINGEYVVEDLKDFMSVCTPINPQADWEALLDVLKTYKNIEVLSRPSWKKVLGSLAAMRRSGTLLLLSQYLSKDPYYQAPTDYPQDHIVEAYLTQVKTQVETVLQKITEERRSSKLNALVQQVFGTTGISRTKNYTEKANLAFSKKRLSGYTFIEPLNYLKAFLLDFYKRDIRELVNLLLIKGQWMSNALAQPLSESFHVLMEASERLTAFDESLAEDTDRGQKMKVLLMRSDKDQNAMISLKQQLKDINGAARNVIIEAATHLVVVGKHLKMAIDDHAKAKHELILNWKSLELSTDRKLHDWMTDTYKQIYAFVQLMQFFIKDRPPQE